VEHVARVWERKGAFSVLVEKSQGRRLLTRPRSRLKVNTKMDLQEVRWGETDWIDLTPNRDRWRTLTLDRLTLASQQKLL
jgi:hypothetical protein